MPITNVQGETSKLYAVWTLQVAFWLYGSRFSRLKILKNTIALLKNSFTSTNPRHVTRTHMLESTSFNLFVWTFSSAHVTSAPPYTGTSARGAASADRYQWQRERRRENVSAKTCVEIAVSFSVYAFWALFVVVVVVAVVFFCSCCCCCASDVINFCIECKNY